MRKLTEQISEQMSLGAARQGLDVPAERLYRPVERYLSEVESVLTRDIVESFHPRDWAILFSHAKANAVEPRSVLMEILSGGMQRSARVIARMAEKQAAQKVKEQAAVRPRPALKLVK